MKLISIFQIIIAVILITVILMQNKGSGLSGLFGGTGGGAYQTKRGLEKNLFTATIVAAILFFLISLANILLA